MCSAKRVRFSFIINKTIFASIFVPEDECFTNMALIPSQGWPKFVLLNAAPCSLAGDFNQRKIQRYFKARSWANDRICIRP